MTPMIKLSQDALHPRSMFEPKKLTKADLMKNLDLIPNDVIREISAKLYLLINITWGYIDTLVSMCIESGMDETKKKTRRIRALRVEYDKFRAPYIGDKETMSETEMGEWFEELFSHDFDTLFAGIEHEASKMRLDGSKRLYVVALQQVLTLSECIKGYARHCDGILKEYNALYTPYNMLQKEIIETMDILHTFPCAFLPGFASVRQLSSKIILNRLHAIEVGIHDGKIVLRLTDKK